MSAITIAAILLALSGSAASASARGVHDDTCAQANQLATGLHGPFWSEDTFFSARPGQASSDPDWYRWTVQPGQEIRVTATRLASLGDVGALVAELREGPCPGNLLATLWNGGTSTVRNTTGQPIDYSIHVYALVFFEGSFQVEYTLDVEIGFSPGCALTPEDAFEGAAGVPFAMAPGVYSGLFASSTNDDEYSLRLPARTAIRVRTDFVPEQGDLDLEVRDGSVTLLSNGVTGQESIDYVATPPAAFRDVVVRVAPKAGLTDVCNTYTLTIEVLQALGTNSCIAGVNGHGTGATILGAGSTSVSANSLSFVCQAFPGANPGILVAGSTQTQVVFGDGFRCVGGVLLRLGGSSAIGGVATYPVDFTTAPGGLLTAGTTWNFQVFYRDLTLVGGAGFNLSDAVSIPLTP